MSSSGITYELAPELQNVGFPEHNEGKHNDQCLYGKPCVPTLSELIEACGDKFGGVIRGGKQNSGGKRFTAFMDGLEVLRDKTIEDDDPVPSAEGSSPEEAVARLWLALNPRV